jgi:chromosome segregation protein
MRLQTLRLHGFKSFADRTQIEFRDGVTAIIGSNGCGKSNIADAIRWVLGEQRASAIRGARMDEVIFQGTARRRSLSFAEVSLLFSNEEGRVPVPQTEIEVSRRVFREGGSEYALNRAGCRLRDIHSLLRDTGLGSNAYAIIEGTMIETLLSDRAEERRALFEEAAGIGRYKDSRHAALRRLEGAEGDLARLDDLITEVESKVRTLARQKRRAQRHRELHALRLNLEMALARHELEAAAASLLDGERRRTALREAEVSAAVEAATAEQEEQTRRAGVVQLQQARLAASERLENVRARLEVREKEVLLADERRAHAELRLQQRLGEGAEQRERLDHLQRESDRLAAEQGRKAAGLAELRERGEERSAQNEAIRAALATGRAEVESAAARVRDLARESAVADGERSTAERRRRETEERIARLGQQELDLTGELERASEEERLWSSRVEDGRRVLGELEVEHAAVLGELRDLREAHDRGRAGARETEDRLGRLAAQLAARESLERGYDGFAPAVAALLAERGRFPGVLGPLADFVTTPRGDPLRARALETALGAYLQALVVRDLPAARAVRRWFREEWTGGGALLLLPLDAPLLREAGRPEGAGEAGEAWVDALLGGPVETAPDALAATRVGAVLVSGDDVVDTRGVARLA